MTDLRLADLPPQTQALRGRVILITGASSGIGRAAALHCAEQGATVILVGRDVKKLEAVYDAIEAANFPQPAIFELNLKTANEQHYTALAKVIDEEFGQLDGLLHNAGELGQLCPLEQISPAVWHEVVQVNLTGPFLLTRALLPLLRKGSAARILFTSSSVGRKGRAFWGVYAVSKAGIENLTQTLADELENTPIKVNSLNPGATRTAMRAAAYPAEDPATVKSAESIAPAYGFLLSEACQWNGEQVSLVV
ncbi:MAG TPA: YciK family oxidoreductase [Marinagarivorans sp.]|nr:YciK family oxidoreductase [Cellvibrionaceae bacterium]HMY39912.1 YciK family oxidoreductase [Marinagarivorans sp.]